MNKKDSQKEKAIEYAKSYLKSEAELCSIIGRESQKVTSWSQLASATVVLYRTS